MTYNVFAGTLNLAQSINQSYVKAFESYRLRGRQADTTEIIPRRFVGGQKC